MKLLDVKYVSDLNGHIISTGGGVVLRPENIKYLKQNGIIIYIDRPIDNILTDVQVTSRPLLKEGPQKLYELDKQRHQLYLEACDHRIVNDDTLENITDKIIELITKNKFRINPQTYFFLLFSFFICIHFSICAFECIL